MERLFVYGTLKRGEPLHHLLEGARFLGEGRVKGYALYDLGDYPAARPAGPQEAVLGEVYEIEPERLTVLDEVEDEYRRLRVQVELEDGASLSAWMYVYHTPLPETLRLPGGRWPKRSAP